MPKRQTGSRSLRKRAALLDYARPDSVSLKVAPVAESRPPVLKEILDTGPIDCQPPEEDEPPSSGGGALASEAPPAEPPPAEATTIKTEKFGSYELIWEISRDAISTTHAVRNPAFEGMLALRIFNERITDSAQVRSIQKAALKSAELTHPNHAAVYDNGLGENGTPYVVSEWIEGEALSELFRRKKRLDIASFLNIFGQINDVVADAHSRNLMHGNLSPQKIILATNDIEADIVKVIDFGMPVDPIQNAYYMSPEQYFDNNRVDVRSDIYSIGCMMYESLVGRPPSHGSQTTQTSVDFLHELANQYSKDSQEHNALKLLDCIIKRCLQKKPAKRFTSLRELNNALSLVADCFNHPGTRKLPRDAEKLLLFRFLDLFDKKITAVMMAYLVLGLCATKYIGELQLQKYIDDGQLAMDADWPRAQTNFAAAIKQADLIGKPPSLTADLHWVLGDAYCLQAAETNKDITQNNLAKKAIAQYETAYEYYKRGSFSRSLSLWLIDEISSLWYNMSDHDLLNEKRNATLTRVESLWKAKNYSACAQLANSFLGRWDDPQIEKYARKAETQLAGTLPPAKALYHLGRAQYYGQTDEKITEEQNAAINKVMEKLKVHWQLQATHLHYACRALLDGDEVAASGLLQRANYDVSHSFDERLSEYLMFKKETYKRVDKDPAALEAIKHLEKSLELRGKYYDKDSEANAVTLERLADCYRLSGDSQKAMATYKRLFALTPSGSFGKEHALLAYVDLLRDNGQAKAVPKLLEEALFNDHTPDPTNPLIIRLVQAYSQAGMPERAEDTLALLTDIPEAVAYNSKYVFDENHDILNTPDDYKGYSPKQKQMLKAIKKETDPFAAAATTAEEPAEEKPASAVDANF